MLLRIIRWLRGYVIFTVNGRFPERFINLVNRYGIRAWDMLPYSGGFRGYMTSFCYRDIRSTARKAGVKLKIEKKSGLPFVIKRQKKRIGLPIGAALCAIMLAILGNYVWIIELNGAEGLSQCALNSALEHQGLYIGALKSGINAYETVRGVELEIPEIRWMSVNMLGNKAEVEIKLKHIQPKVNDISKPCNIKSGFDGVITKMIVHSGTAKVKVGSAVTKDTLLVSSKVKNSDDSKYYVTSDAEIYADVNSRFVFSTPSLKNVYYIDNCVVKPDVNINGFCFPVALGEPMRGLFAKNSYYYNLQVLDTILPVGLVAEHGNQIKCKRIKLIEKAQKMILKKNISLAEVFLEPESKVIERKITYIQNENSLKASVNYVFNKNIAVRKNIKVENE